MASSNVSTNVEPDRASLSVVYVHFNSGDVVKISPATSVLVQPHMVVIYNGDLAVASYPRQDVFSCSRSETCPSFT